jgi:hypothetical protein
MNQPRTIRQVLDLLRESGFEAVVLQGDGGRTVVVVVPDLVGRVLCVGSEGIDGPTESYFSEDEIRRGFDSAWANFGGEQRIWIAPEFGPLGLFVTYGEQTMTNYQVPPALNATRFNVVERSADRKSVTSAATMTLVNQIGAEFQVRIEQKVECAETCPYLAVAERQASFVGFRTLTTIENIGRVAWNKEAGPLALWTIGQFPAREGTVAMMPFRSGPGSEVGKPLTTEYFKLFGPDPSPLRRPYCRVKEGVVLLKADGSVEKKFEVPASRALNRLGSIDHAAASMTIVDYDDLQPDREYVKSFPQPYEDPCQGGGAMSVMLLNSHPPEPACHELETCSPALYLKPGEKRTHGSCTYHLKADEQALAEVCKKYFNANLESVIGFRKSRT